MKRNLFVASGFLYFFFWATLLFMSTAQAYLDPAAVSYIIQIVAGLFITLGAVAGVFRKKIQLYFRNQKLKRLERKLTKQSRAKG